MASISTRTQRFGRAICAVLLVSLLASLSVAAQPAGVRAADNTASAALTSQQRAVLLGIARDTWKFYSADVDPHTQLPLDNIGPAGKRGTYTSAANIGVFLWAVVAANDLGLISRPAARAQIVATLNTVSNLRRFDGFLFQWYDTTTGHVIRNPGDVDCTTEPTPVMDNCYFLSAVDNGWYASGLVVVRSAMPELRHLVDSLISPMNFGIFYDNRPQIACNTNPAVPGNQPTGQMYGGYYADQGPAGYHNGALYSDPRIAMYMGMGLHQMPGDVWWRSWRTLPPKQCTTTDPDFSWQGQWPVDGYWHVYTDPVSGKQFNVWEGHYTYPGSSLTFVPTWAGGMFEGLMANLVVPETTWGPRGFGLNDLRWAQVQVKYATEQLHFPVWGLSPSSTPDDTGNYGGYGVEGLLFPYFGGGADASHPNMGLSQCHGCATEDTVTPHASFIALGVLPQEAYANIQMLRTRYPDIYDPNGGFYDAVNPISGAVGHRRLVLDQSMIMAALDNALNDNALQRQFARDPVSWAAHLELAAEQFSIQ
ncbi:MAG TPA: glucoamylase family protein [Chloroflexota bacterium]|nr:glucoamylase family protein [Chloroflexota bacterium]